MNIASSLNPFLLAIFRRSLIVFFGLFSSNFLDVFNLQPTFKMQYAIVTLLGLAGAALAQVAGFDAITSPPESSTLKAGETFSIVWEAAPANLNDELIDIVLLAGGSPSTLSAVDPPIAST